MLGDLALLRSSHRSIATFKAVGRYGLSGTSKSNMTPHPSQKKITHDPPPLPYSSFSSHNHAISSSWVFEEIHNRLRFGRVVCHELHRKDWLEFLDHSVQFPGRMPPNAFFCPQCILLPPNAFFCPQCIFWFFFPQPVQLNLWTDFLT
jgi:hypothetical protein